MNRIHGLRNGLIVITPIVLSAFGMKVSVVHAVTDTTPALALDAENSTLPMAQTCPGSDRPLPYARVTTRDGDHLNIRSGPNGRVIGSVPNGWEVVTLERDSSGRWIRITGEYGYDPFPYGSGSAENFRSGWVSANYLVRIPGEHCQKPSRETMGLVQPELFGDRPVVIQDDWLNLADRIAAA